MNNEESVRILNVARTMELGAINVYMRIHYELANRRLLDLADRVKEVAISEMKHAEGLSERIAELGGAPTLDRDIPSESEDVKRDVIDLYGTLHYMELNTVDAYNELIRELGAAEDEVSARLLKRYIEEENEHMSYFDDIMGAIGMYGDTFLAQHIKV